MSGLWALFSACLFFCLLNLENVFGQPGLIAVTTSGQLLSAIQNETVTDICVNSTVMISLRSLRNYKLPIVVSRDITLSSCTSVLETVNFNFTQGIMTVEAGCSLNFTHIIIQNSRYGPGYDLDFLTYSPNSFVFMNSVIKRQSVCSGFDITAIVRYPVAGNYPANYNHNVSVLNTWCQPNNTSLCWNNVIWYKTFAVVGIQAAIESDSNSTAFIVVQANVHKACDIFVGDSCTKLYGPVVCVRTAIDKILSMNNASRKAESERHKRIIIATVVSVVGVTIIAVLLAAFFIRRRRRSELRVLETMSGFDHGYKGWLKDAKSPGDSGQDTGSELYFRGPKAGQGDMTSVSGGTNSTKLKDSFENFCSGGLDPMATGASVRRPPSAQPAHRINDMEFAPVDVSNCASMLRMHSNVGTSAASVFQGFDGQGNRFVMELLPNHPLGKGSYGTVYKGFWNDKIVAIKILQHTSSNKSSVENEVKLMMRFRHPNVVSALHYVQKHVSRARPGSRENNGSGAGAVRQSGDQNASGGTSLGSQQNPGDSEGPQEKETHPDRSSVELALVETWVVEEYCGGGSLQEALCRGSGRRAGRPWMHWILPRLLEVARGMAYLQELNVIHSDLKTANVLLSEDTTTSAVTSTTNTLTAASGSGIPGGLTAVTTASNNPFSSQTTVMASIGSPGVATPASASSANTSSMGFSGARTPAVYSDNDVNSASASPFVSAHFKPPAAVAAAAAAAAVVTVTVEEGGVCVPGKVGAKPEEGASNHSSFETLGASNTMIKLRDGVDIASVDRTRPIRLSSLHMSFARGEATLPETIMEGLEDGRGSDSTGSEPAVAAEESPNLDQSDERNSQQQSNGNGGASAPSSLKQSKEILAMPKEAAVPFTAALMGSSTGPEGLRLIAPLRKQAPSSSTVVPFSGAAARPLGEPLSGHSSLPMDNGSIQAPSGVEGQPSLRSIESTNDNEQQYCYTGGYSNGNGTSQSCVVPMAPGLKATSSTGHASGLSLGFNSTSASAGTVPSSGSQQPQQSGVKTFIAKVADFGLSRALAIGQTHASTRALGTVTHMAPELLCRGKLSPLSDVYSFGIIMWEMITARMPYENMHFGQVVTTVMRGGRPTFPGFTPPAYVALAHRCWAAQPRDRPMFREVTSELEQLIEQADALQAQLDEALTEGGGTTSPYMASRHGTSSTADGTGVQLTSGCHVEEVEAEPVPGIDFSASPTGDFKDDASFHF